MLPRYFQSRYRRHLFNFKRLFQLPLARRSLIQLSRLRIHPVQEFKISSIQSRQDVRETNIVVIYNHIPQRSVSFSFPTAASLSSGVHRALNSRRRGGASCFTYVSLYSRAFPIQMVSDDICATSFPTTCIWPDQRVSRRKR